MSILYYQPSINLSPPPTITTMARELTSGPMEACCMKENGKTVLWMEMGHSTIQMETDDVAGTTSAGSQELPRLAQMHPTPTNTIGH